MKAAQTRIPETEATLPGEENMDKPLRRVREFHRTYGVLSAEQPHIPDADICALRIALIQEELDELKEAFDDGDIVAVADALGDLTVVVDGTYDSCGLARHKEAISAEIHASNMSKLGEDGKPIHREDGKVLKGPNIFPPDLEKVLKG